MVYPNIIFKTFIFFRNMKKMIYPIKILFTMLLSFRPLFVNTCKNNMGQCGLTPTPCPNSVIQKILIFVGKKVVCNNCEWIVGFEIVLAFEWRLKIFGACIKCVNLEWRSLGQGVGVRAHYPTFKILVVGRRTVALYRLPGFSHCPGVRAPSL